MKKTVTDFVVLDRPCRRLGFGGGSLAISLVFHGALVALGVFWILRVIPEPEDKGFEVPLHGRGAAADRPSLKPSQASASFRDAARAAAVGVSGAVTLPEPVHTGGMSALGQIGGGSLSPGGKSGNAGESPVIACFGAMEKPGNLIFDFGPRASRIAYVIDFSMSMRADGRDELMRDELARSVKALPDRTKYQLIFFSGPAWVAGDEVSGNTVRHQGKDYRWTSKSLWEWAPVGPAMKVGWEEASDSQKKKSVQLIRETELVGGTDWETPLEMAMAMEPPPEQIFFMTDGAMENRDMARLVRNLAATANERKIRIHTVNMMVPQKDAVDAMGDLASKTGGTFTIIEKGGKVRRGK